MAPLPQNNTDRWFLDYVTGTGPTSAEHTMSVRLGPDAGVDGASGVFLGVLNGIGSANLWAGWKPIRMRLQKAGTKFSLPVGMGSALSAFIGTGSNQDYRATTEALELTWQGRSFTTGRRVDLSLYGFRQTGILGEFRYTSAAFAPGGAVVASLSAQTGASAPLAIDGTEVTWYEYTNFNYNSYWEGRIRKG